MEVCEGYYQEYPAESYAAEAGYEGGQSGYLQQDCSVGEPLNVPVEFQIQTDDNSGPPLPDYHYVSYSKQDQGHDVHNMSSRSNSEASFSDSDHSDSGHDKSKQGKEEKKKEKDKKKAKDKGSKNAGQLPVSQLQGLTLQGGEQGYIGPPAGYAYSYQQHAQSAQKFAQPGHPPSFDAIGQPFGGGGGIGVPADPYGHAASPEVAHKVKEKKKKDKSKNEGEKQRDLYCGPLPPGAVAGAGYAQPGYGGPAAVYPQQPPNAYGYGGEDAKPKKKDKVKSKDPPVYPPSLTADPRALHGGLSQPQWPSYPQASHDTPGTPYPQQPANIYVHAPATAMDGGVEGQMVKKDKVKSKDSGGLPVNPSQPTYPVQPPAAYFKAQPAVPGFGPLDGNSYGAPPTQDLRAGPAEVFSALAGNDVVKQNKRETREGLKHEVHSSIVEHGTAENVEEKWSESEKTAEEHRHRPPPVTYSVAPGVPEYSARPSYVQPPDPAGFGPPPPEGQHEPTSEDESREGVAAKRTPAHVLSPPSGYHPPVGYQFGPSAPQEQPASNLVPSVFPAQPVDGVPPHYQGLSECGSGEERPPPNSYGSDPERKGKEDLREGEAEQVKQSTEVIRHAQQRSEAASSNLPHPPATHSPYGAPTEAQHGLPAPVNTLGQPVQAKVKHSKTKLEDEATEKSSIPCDEHGSPSYAMASTVTPLASPEAYSHDGPLDGNVYESEPIMETKDKRRHGEKHVSMDRHDGPPSVLPSLTNSHGHGVPQGHVYVSEPRKETREKNKTGDKEKYNVPLGAHGNPQYSDPRIYAMATQMGHGVPNVQAHGSAALPGVEHNAQQSHLAHVSQERKGEKDKYRVATQVQGHPQYPGGALPIAQPAYPIGTQPGYRGQSMPAHRMEPGIKEKKEKQNKASIGAHGNPQYAGGPPSAQRAYPGGPGAHPVAQPLRPSYGMQPDGGQHTPLNNYGYGSQFSQGNPNEGQVQGKKEKGKKGEKERQESAYGQQLGQHPSSYGPEIPFSVARAGTAGQHQRRNSQGHGLPPQEQPIRHQAAPQQGWPPQDGQQYKETLPPRTVAHLGAQQQGWPAQQGHGPGGQAYQQPVAGQSIPRVRTPPQIWTAPSDQATPMQPSAGQGYPRTQPVQGTHRGVLQYGQQTGPSVQGYSSNPIQSAPSPQIYIQPQTARGLQQASAAGYAPPNTGYSNPSAQESNILQQVIPGGGSQWSTSQYMGSSQPRSQAGPQGYGIARPMMQQQQQPQPGYGMTGQQSYPVRSLGSGQQQPGYGGMGQPMYGGGQQLDSQTGGQQPGFVSSLGAALGNLLTGGSQQPQQPPYSGSRSTWNNTQMLQQQPPSQQRMFQQQQPQPQQRMFQQQQQQPQQRMFPQQQQPQGQAQDQQQQQQQDQIYDGQQQGYPSSNYDDQYAGINEHYLYTTDDGQGYASFEDIQNQYQETYVDQSYGTDSSFDYSEW